MAMNRLVAPSLRALARAPLRPLATLRAGAFSARAAAPARAFSLSTPTLLTPETVDTRFEAVSISPALSKNVQENFGIQKWFPIQAGVFGPVTEGRDVVAKSRTGSGKTLAFCMPLVQRIILERLNPTVDGTLFLILEPTRELAKQVESDLKRLAPGLRVASIYGGSSYQVQELALRSGLHFVVATPGRLIDLMDRGMVSLETVRGVILDETDEMLKMGFKEALDTILRATPAEKQTLLFSATVPGWVLNAAHRLCRNPVFLDAVGSDAVQTSTTIQHYAVPYRGVPDRNRRMVASMQKLMPPAVPGSISRAIVFCPTKAMCADMAQLIATSMGTPNRRPQVLSIHGDVAQATRERELERFRESSHAVLVATDVAARGIDIPEVGLVVCLDVPAIPETYVHRSGRTGRAGRSGSSVLMFNTAQSEDVLKIYKDAGARFHLLNLASEDPRGLLESPELRGLGRAQEIVAALPAASAAETAVAERLMEEAAAADPERGVAKLVARLVSSARAAVQGPTGSGAMAVESLISLRPGLVTLESKLPRAELEVLIREAGLERYVQNSSLVTEPESGRTFFDVREDAPLAGILGAEGEDGPQVLLAKEMPLDVGAFRRAFPSGGAGSAVPSYGSRSQGGHMRQYTGRPTYGASQRGGSHPWGSGSSNAHVHRSGNSASYGNSGSPTYGGKGGSSYGNRGGYDRGDY